MAEVASVQLFPKSVEFALQYSRGVTVGEITPRIQAQLESILGGIEVTQEGFQLVVKIFAASHDNVENT